MRAKWLVAFKFHSDPPPVATTRRPFGAKTWGRQAAERLGRAVSTTYEYLEAYIRHRRITDASRWVPPRELEQIEVVVQYAGAERLKPIHEALHGRVGYETIRIAVACLANRARRI
jgi:hypothetical protein